MFATKSSISKTNKLHFCGYSSFSANLNFILENKDCKSLFDNKFSSRSYLFVDLNLYANKNMLKIRNSQIKER